MADDHYEPNRFLGFPVRTARPPRPAQPGETQTQAQPRAQPRAQGEESQRVMGFPVDWLGASDQPRPLAQLIRSCKRWLHRDEHQP